MRKLLFVITGLMLLFGESTAQTVVSGDVFGYWTKDSSPYFVTNDIIVQSDKQLIIEPGVEVIFQGHFELIVKGRILALGSINDSVSFTINDTAGFSNLSNSLGSWGGIEFDSDVDDVNLFRFCKFQFAKQINSGGGAIRFLNFDGVLDISNCTFKNNYATSGGAIRYDGWDKGPLLIKNSSFESNFANYGGAICAWSYNQLKEVSNCIFRNNFAVTKGGALYIQATGTKLFNCIFKDNVASVSGGAMTHGSSSSLKMYNCIFDSNSSANGAAFSTFGGAVDSDIVNCTFINNISDNSILYFIDDYNEVTILNSIIWNINSPQISMNSGITAINIENSVIKDAADSLWFSESCVDQHPQIIGLDIGYSLEETSPCINNGNNTYLNQDIKVDFFNNCRVWNTPDDINEIVDIGAVESNSQDSMPSNLMVLIGDTLCEGVSFIFKITEEYNDEYDYTWFYNSDTLVNDANILSLTNISPENTAFYSCMVSNEYGDVSSDFTGLEVLSIPEKPSEPIGNDTVFSNTISNYYIDQLTFVQQIEWILIPQSAGDYTYNDTSITINWNNSFNGNAELVVNHFNESCNTYSDTLSIYIEEGLSIRNMNHIDLHIYPNPTNDNFTVDFEQLDKTAKLVIYNNIGQAVHSQILDSEKSLINKDLDRGLYFLHILDVNYNAIIKKLLVK